MKVTLDQAIVVLQRGDLLIYPTETFYALGCIPTTSALDQLCHIKDRQQGSKTFPLLVGSPEFLPLFAKEWGVLHQNLMDTFWPGPLTLLMKAQEHLDARIMNAENEIAIRQTPHLLAQQLSNACKSALVSTSANFPNQPPCSTTDDLLEFAEMVRIPILEGGTLLGGKPSTLCDIKEGKIRILREGVISYQELLDWETYAKR